MHQRKGNCQCFQILEEEGHNDPTPSIGRKNFLFAGSDAGGEILADAMTVIETAKLSGLDPEAYLTDILITNIP